MVEEKREHQRTEPPHLSALIKYDKDEYKGKILDASSSGMAIILRRPETVIKPEELVHISIVDSKAQDHKRNIGQAIVLRVWQDNNIYDRGIGIAVNYEHNLPEETISSITTEGTDQKRRLEAQSELSSLDINYLTNYRRDLLNCQLRLFVLALTVGVSLSGAYFGLSYHSAANGLQTETSLSIWRTLVAGLPGLFSMFCATMVAQKSISIQRVDSYILVLKEHLIKKHYPREYRGWEHEYRKFRCRLNTVICDECGNNRKCGTLKSEDFKELNNKKIFNNPGIDLYHIITNLSFFGIFFISLSSVIFELINFQLGVKEYMTISSLITITFLLSAGYLFYIYYHLRKGKYSIVQFKRCWADLFNRCSPI